MKKETAKCYEGTNIEIDDRIYYKDRYNGRMLTQREYIEMIKRESKELHRSIYDCLANEDQYFECDEDGNDWYANEW